MRWSDSLVLFAACSIAPASFILLYLRRRGLVRHPDAKFIGLSFGIALVLNLVGWQTGILKPDLLHHIGRIGAVAALCAALLALKLQRERLDKLYPDVDPEEVQKEPLHGKPDASP